MSPENARAIDQALGALPLDDRVFALVANIITRKPQAAKAVISLAAALTAYGEDTRQARADRHCGNFAGQR